MDDREVDQEGLKEEINFGRGQSQNHNADAEV